MAFGIPQVETRDWNFKNDVTVVGDFTVEGDFTFGDATTDTLTVAGAFSQTGANTLSTGTATVSLNGNIEVASGKELAGVGTGTTGLVIKNIKNHAWSALSGTSVNLEVNIGGTAYYFSVYPTKA